MGKTSICPRLVTCGALVVINIWKNIHFSKVFCKFGHAPIDSKNEYFPGFGWKFHVLQRFPLLPRAGMVAFVVGGSKYGENIHFPLFFYRFAHVPIDPKNEYFPIFGWKFMLCKVGWW
jgi:hypothetical protein